MAGVSYISIKGQSHKVMNRWCIPRYLEDAYCQNDVVIRDGDEIIEVFASHVCAGCGRKYSEASRPTRLLCNNDAVNRHFGYVVPICVDCYWFLQSLLDQPVPRTIREVLEQGFRPRKIWELIE